MIDAACKLWLIPLYGMNGAALATPIAMGFAALVTGLALHRHLTAANRTAQPQAN
ncbi:hypothetical protein [Marinobacterium arenosum]